MTSPDWLGELAGCHRAMRSLCERPENVALVFVISVLEETKVLRDYEGFSISASFQKRRDASDFIEAVRSLGFYAQAFFEEREFFSWVLAGGFGALKQDIKFVYTAAVNSTGPGRRALVPAFCNHMGIPTINLDPYHATLGRHKHNVACFLRANGVGVPDSWLIFPNGKWRLDRRPPDNLRVIAKATYEGSSIGLSKEGIFEYAASHEVWLQQLATKLSQPITVQEFIDGPEFEVPLFEFKGVHVAQPLAVLDAAGQVTGTRTLDYDTVWSEEYRYAAVTSQEESTTLAATAILCSELLGHTGVTRIDVRLDQARQPRVFDVSGTPDLTTMSSCATAITNAGRPYSDLWLLGLASAAARSGAINERYSSLQN